jgi:hypothetical protein
MSYRSDVGGWLAHPIAQMPGACATRTMTFPACPCVVKIAQSEKVDQTVIRRLLFKCRLFLFLASSVAIIG